MLTAPITNDKEYRSVRAEADRLAIEIAKQNEQIQNLDPRLRLAMQGASSGRLQELRERLAWYETLQRSGGAVIELTSLQSLPDLLGQARIAANLTQRDLAERLGVAPQQVQKDEKGEYRRASLERLAKTARVLGLEMKLAAILPSSAASAQAQRLMAGFQDDSPGGNAASAPLKPYELIGYRLIDRDGEDLGEVCDLWVDGETHRLKVIGFLASNEPNVTHLVPAFAATAATGTLQLFYTQPAALGGPVIPRGVELAEDALKQLGDVFGPWASSTDHPIVHFSASEEGPTVLATARLPVPEAPLLHHAPRQDMEGGETDRSSIEVHEISSESMNVSVPNYATIQPTGGIEVEVTVDENNTPDHLLQS